jgi:hypothetical protein
VPRRASGRGGGAQAAQARRIDPPGSTSRAAWTAARSPTTRGPCCA